VEDVCRFLRDRYGSDLLSQFDYSGDISSAVLGIADFQITQKVTELVSDEKPVLLIKLEQSALVNPAKDPTPKPGETVTWLQTIVSFGYSDTIVNQKWIENRGDHVETLRTLLKNDTRKPLEKLTAKEKKELNDLEKQLQREGDSPSKIDSLLAFLLNEKSKQRALAWIRESSGRH
jgi:hypothetical protein